LMLLKNLQMIREQTQEEKEWVLEVWHSWKTCKWPKSKLMKKENDHWRFNTLWKTFKHLESKHKKKKNECWKFGALEKLANDQKVNSWRERMTIGGSTLLKNLQTTREQTQEEKTNTWGCSSLSNWKAKLSSITS
jgi:hypothetical protein